MELINKQKHIINKNKYYLQTVKDHNHIKQQLLNDNYDVIIPLVDKIIIKPTSKIIFVKDKIIINEDLIGSIYYYVNLTGIPVGYCFNNIFPDEIYPLPFDRQSAYLVGYEEYKDCLISDIKVRLQNRIEFNEKLCLDLALHHQK